MKDEGPKEMTLDEWKAMQDKDRAKVEFNIRKVKEGEDWNKGFVLHKSKAEVGQMHSHLTVMNCGSLELYSLPGVCTNRICRIVFIYKKCQLLQRKMLLNVFSG